MHYKILFMLNMLREFLYNSSNNELNKIKNMPTKESLNDLLDSIYNDYATNFESSSDNTNYLTQNYTDLENKIKHSDLCYLSDDLFPTYFSKLGVNCASFMSNSSSFGLNVITSNLIELSQTVIMQYSDPKKNFTDIMLNDERIRDINIQIIFFIDRAYKILINSFIDMIKQKIESFDLIYLVVLFIYIFYTLIKYFLLARNSIENMNTTVKFY
jgi:hypothetical protein